MTWLELDKALQSYNLVLRILAAAPVSRNIAAAMTPLPRKYNGTTMDKNWPNILAPISSHAYEITGTVPSSQ